MKKKGIVFGLAVVFINKLLCTILLLGSKSVLSIKMSSYASSSGMDSGSSEAPLEVETKQLQSDVFFTNAIVVSHGKNLRNEQKSFSLSNFYCR